jgi:uncharacterized protein
VKSSIVVIVAAVEAIGVLDWPKVSLRVLSLGCTSESFNAGNARFLPRGLGYWAPRIVDLFMNAQSSSSMGTAYVLLGHDDVLRINPRVPSGRYDLDTHERTDSLRGLGDSKARYALPEIRRMFVNEGLAEQFEPYKKLDTGDQEPA